MRPVLAALLALSSYCTGAQPELWQTHSVAKPTAKDSLRESFERLAFKSLKLSDYKTTIHPVMPESGITTGMVFVYGHPIPRPYRVELNDTVVLVNGIQVYPTPKTPEMLAREKARAESLPPLSSEVLAQRESVDVVSRRLPLLYQALLPRLGHALAFDSVLRFLKRSPHVDSVWRSDDRNLWIRYAGYKHPVLTPVPLCSSTQVDSSSKARLLIHASDTTAAVLAERHLAEALNKGRVFLFRPPLSRSVVDMATVSATRVVLEDTDHSEEDKYIRLCSVIGGADAKWLLANYSEAEWTWVNE